MTSRTGGHVGHDLSQFEDGTGVRTPNTKMSLPARSSRIAVELLAPDSCIAGEATPVPPGSLEVAIPWLAHCIAEPSMSSISLMCEVLGALGCARRTKHCVPAPSPAAVRICGSRAWHAPRRTPWFERLPSTPASRSVSRLLASVSSPVEDFVKAWLGISSTTSPNSSDQFVVGVGGEARIVVAFGDVFSILGSFNQHPEIVSIIPGMENFAPERRDQQRRRRSQLPPLQRSRVPS